MSVGAGLAERLGLALPAAALDGLQRGLEAAAERAWSRLEDAGRLHPRAIRPRLELPAGFGEWLAAALALEQAEGGAEADARAAQLRALYLEGMPALRVEQLAVAEAPNDFLFHAPLAWERLPRLSGALDRAFDLLAQSGVPASALGAAGVRNGLQVILHRVARSLGRIRVANVKAVAIPLLVRRFRAAEREGHEHQPQAGLA